MSIVIKRTGRKDNREPTEREAPLKKWRLTFCREKYPTPPIIVRKPAVSHERASDGGGDADG